MLSSQAFNAFLKTLEEPPAPSSYWQPRKNTWYCLLFCPAARFTISTRISIADTETSGLCCSKENIESRRSGAEYHYPKKADGAMRDALSIFDQVVASCGGSKITYGEQLRTLNVLDYNYYFKLVNNFKKGNVSQTLLTLNDSQQGFDTQNFVNGLNKHFRDFYWQRHRHCHYSMWVIMLKRHTKVKVPITQTTFCIKLFALQMTVT